LKPASIAYIPADAFGFEGLDRVFTAGYRIGDTKEELTAFISRRESPGEAQKKADEFIQFMLSFGGIDVSESAGASKVKMVNFLDAIDAVIVRGSIVVGVHEAPDTKSATFLIGKIYENINEK
jgi:hypothetical protein